MAVQIAVIGSGKADGRTAGLAREVGAEIARRGVTLICGGLGGVMEGAARGAREEGGMTVGILPGDDRADANPYVDYTVVTGMGHARNVLVVKSADAVVALPGGNGTLSEIALALKMGKRVVAIGAWETIEGVIVVDNPREAVDVAIGPVQ
jgi:uncharacterized protein (TIGR00725 family)